MVKLCITMGPDWPLAQEEFKRVGLSVERFDAIVEDNRVLAFNKSVYGAMMAAESQDLCLFEDDVVFDNDFGSCKGVTAGFILSLAANGPPEDFLTIHLGANIIGTDLTSWKMPERHNTHFAKLHNCFQSHATLYSAECVKFIIDNFKFVTDEYKTEGCMIFDEWLRVNVLSQGRSYLLNPMIAYQRPRKSEIWNCHADYTGAHKQGNEWLKNNL